MSLKTKLKKKKVTIQKAVWKGPEVDGITQSLLSRFLVCRERFRIQVIEGLAPAPQFYKALEYGNMWHLCEEMHAQKKDWKKPLQEYCLELCKQYKENSFEIIKWWNICTMQFPVYVNFWKKDSDTKSRKNLLPEISFKIPYKLPSGRTVLLKGKWDSVDVIGNGKQAGIFLQENKTKGDIDEEKMKNILSSGFELQTMMYLTALTEYQKQNEEFPKTKIKGVRYNVIRRPLSGGKGSIRQKKGTKNTPPETSEEFYARLKTDYIEEDPAYFFMRWKVEVTLADLKRFQEQCLNPILEQLCCWYDLQLGSSPQKLNPSNLHFRYPSGIYNPINEGRTTDLDNYLNTGNAVGLQRVETLFPELDEE